MTGNLHLMQLLMVGSTPEDLLPMVAVGILTIPHKMVTYTQVQTRAVVVLQTVCHQHLHSHLLVPNTSSITTDLDDSYSQQHWVIFSDLLKFIFLLETSKWRERFVYIYNISQSQVILCFLHKYKTRFKFLFYHSFLDKKNVFECISYAFVCTIISISNGL